MNHIGCPRVRRANPASPCHRPLKVHSVAVASVKHHALLGSSRYRTLSRRNCRRRVPGNRRRRHHVRRNRSPVLIAHRSRRLAGQGDCPNERRLGCCCRNRADAAGARGRAGNGEFIHVKLLLLLLLALLLLLLQPRPIRLAAHGRPRRRPLRLVFKHNLLLLPLRRARAAPVSVRPLPPALSFHCAGGGVSGCRLVLPPLLVKLVHGAGGSARRRRLLRRRLLLLRRLWGEGKAKVVVVVVVGGRGGDRGVQRGGSRRCSASASASGCSRLTRAGATAARDGLLQANETVV